jgi:hypothetical protein
MHILAATTKIADMVHYISCIISRFPNQPNNHQYYSAILNTLHKCGRAPDQQETCKRREWRAPLAAVVAVPPAIRSTDVTSGHEKCSNLKRSATIMTNTGQQDLSIWISPTSRYRYATFPKASVEAEHRPSGTIRVR